MIIDGTNLVLGRLAAYAAKQSLLGEKITIVNCENVIITGSKENIFARYKRLRDMGYPYKGPFVSKMPDRLVRRTVRGMLPRRKPRGREAFKEVMCYIGIPEKYKNEKLETINNAKLKTKTIKYTNLKTVCNYLGAKL